MATIGFATAAAKAAIHDGAVLATPQRKPMPKSGRSIRDSPCSCVGLPSTAQMNCLPHVYAGMTPKQSSSAGHFLMEKRQKLSLKIER